MIALDEVKNIKMYYTNIIRSKEVEKSANYLCSAYKSLLKKLKVGNVKISKVDLVDLQIKLTDLSMNAFIDPEVIKVIRRIKTEYDRYLLNGINFFGLTD